MQRLSSSVCSRCHQLSVLNFGLFEAWAGTSIQVQRRFRTGGHTKAAKAKYAPSKNLTYPPPRPSKFPQSKRAPPRAWTPRGPKPTETHAIDDIPGFVRDGVAKWARLPRMKTRLKEFGLVEHDIDHLLKAFVSEVRFGELTKNPASYQKYSLDIFGDAVPRSTLPTHLDRAYTSLLFQWASDPEQQISLSRTLHASSLSAIHRLSAAGDLSYPADRFPMARSIKRKIIMHVGPTNSGKTHNALCALAAARSGIYAGPLRLLAHEIWERLNLGQIVPLGAKPEPESEVDFEAGSKKAVRRTGNPKYARECNLLTGEEQRIVSEAAMLTSCTVEMVSTVLMFDVAVIDEIQLIADPERGGAWTTAVLGLAAREIHLCGEETAVPIIEKLIEDTGDELVVNRYQRLSPLVVQKDSLRGNLGLVRKGDCVVTFSRSNIFKLKQIIEGKTGLRCAVAYGQLPPEIRSEQAALFNDPNSGYDVMIGSDAIGMGLNLKIKRVIFESVSKWNGIEEMILSVSQMKQIAGRAGRFGLHGDDDSGGYATTLHPQDLPVLCSALAAPPDTPIGARVSVYEDTFVKFVQALPPDSSIEKVYHALTYLARLRSVYRLMDNAKLEGMLRHIDQISRNELPVEDYVLLMNAPINWRNPDQLDVIIKLLHMYRSELHVDLQRAIGNTEMFGQLKETEKLMEEGLSPMTSPTALSLLEMLHKVLVFYVWMSFRSPVAYSDHDHVQALKERTEKALDWCLKGIAFKPKGRSRNILGPPTAGTRQEISWISRRDVQKLEQEKDRAREIWNPVRASAHA